MYTCLVQTPSTILKTEQITVVKLQCKLTVYLPTHKNRTWLRNITNLFTYNVGLFTRLLRPRPPTISTVYRSCLQASLCCNRETAFHLIVYNISYSWAHSVHLLMTVAQVQFLPPALRQNVVIQIIKPPSESACTGFTALQVK